MDISRILPIFAPPEQNEREVGVCQRETFYEYTDLFNAHHFDCRGLIEKGLALEAPEDMYKEK